jgi:hypothetical protein
MEIFASELRKVVAFFRSSLSAGSITSLPRRHFGGLPSVEVGGSALGSMSKALVLRGGRKTFLKVVGKTVKVQRGSLVSVKAV